MKYLSIIILALFFLSSCEESIDFDINQTEELIVIEGLITNQMEFHQIKVSKTNLFNSTAPNPKVSNAAVTVTDSKGTSYRFDEIEPGVYQAIEAFAGEVGETYSMLVDLEGQVYTASETLRPVTTIDALLYAIDEDEMEDPADTGRFYQALIFTREPQETEDFYLFKYFRNDIVENEDGFFVFVTDDTAVDEEVAAWPAPFYYALGDTARVEMYSLTPKAFKHFFDLSVNVTNDGGMFSGQPANVSTNIEGGAIGYFQVSSLESAEVVIE